MDFHPGRPRLLNIVKIGGALIDDEASLAMVLSGLGRWTEPFIVVHGGGTLASDLCRQLGIPPRMHEGRRITDDATLKVAVMTYAGWINKTLVAGLQAHGVQAIGLSGADGDVIRAHKRIVRETDYGWAGDIDEVNGELLASLLRSGLTPVMAPITHDGRGQLLNTNADTIAAAVAGAMAAVQPVRLIYLMDLPGVLTDVDNPASVIPELDVSSIAELQSQGIIRDGMIPKLTNATDALEAGATEVVLTNAASLADGYQPGAGTTIRNNA